MGIGFSKRNFLRALDHEDGFDDVEISAILSAYGEGEKKYLTREGLSNMLFDYAYKKKIAPHMQDYFKAQLFQKWFVEEDQRATKESLQQKVELTDMDMQNDGGWIVTICNEELGTNFASFSNLCDGVAYPPRTTLTLKVHTKQYFQDRYPYLDAVWHTCSAEEIVSTKQFVECMTQVFFAEQLEGVFKRIVYDSHFPVRMALEYAGIFTDLGKRAAYAEYRHIPESMSKGAIRLFEVVSTPLQASWMLEDKGHFKTNVIEKCLKAENGTFVGSARVHKIVGEFWWHGALVEDESKEKKGGHFIQSAIYFLANLLWDLDGTVGRPDFKYYISVLVYLTLTMILSLTVNNIEEDLNTWDFISLAGVVGYLVEEIVEFSKQHPKADFFKDEWNQLDMTINVFWIIALGCRFSQDKDNEPAFLVCQSALMLALWIRLLSAFVFHDTLGPLMISIRKMFQDIYHFLALLVVLLIGYTMALRAVFVAASPVEGYEDGWSINYSLVISALTGEDWAFDPFLEEDKINVAVRVWIVALLFMFLIITMIVLMNLLIAMMGDTYSRVRSNIEEQYALVEMATMMDFGSAGHGLPSPLNLIVIVFYAMMLPFSLCCKKEHGGKYCTYCNTKMGPNQLPAWEADDILQLINDIPTIPEEKIDQFASGIKRRVCANPQCRRMLQKNLFNIWDVLWVKCQGYVVFILISLPFGIATFVLGVAAFIVMFPVFCIYELITNRSKEGSTMDKLRYAKRRAQQHVVNNTGAIGNTFQDLVDEADYKMENAKNRAKTLVGAKSRAPSAKEQKKDNSKSSQSRGSRYSSMQMTRLQSGRNASKGGEENVLTLRRDQSRLQSKRSKKAYVVNGPTRVVRRAQGSFVSIDDSAFNIPFQKVFTLDDTDEVKKEIAALESKIMERMALMFEAYGMQRVATPLPTAEESKEGKTPRVMSKELHSESALLRQEEEETGLIVHGGDSASLEDVDL
jgi:hypothetical protein